MMMMTGKSMASLRANHASLGNIRMWHWIALTRSEETDLYLQYLSTLCSIIPFNSNEINTTSISISSIAIVKNTSVQEHFTSSVMVVRTVSLHWIRDVKDKSLT